MFYRELLPIVLLFIQMGICWECYLRFNLYGTVQKVLSHISFILLGVLEMGAAICWNMQNPKLYSFNNVESQHLM